MSPERMTVCEIVAGIILTKQELSLLIFSRSLKSTLHMDQKTVQAMKNYPSSSYHQYLQLLHNSAVHIKEGKQEDKSLPPLDRGNRGSRHNAGSGWTIAFEVKQK